MPAKTKLIKSDYHKILSSYNLGEFKSSRHLDWAIQNSVYKIATSKGKYILKIYELSKKSFIRFQRDLIEDLAEQGLPVVPIIEPISYEWPAFSKPVTLQPFVEGRPLKQINPALAANLGRNLGRMDSLLLKRKLTGKYTWGKHFLFSPQEGPKNNVYGTNFRKAERDLLDKLKKLDRSKLRRSLIHSDFHGTNLLIKNNRLVAILDWDDCHENYLIFELAVLIMGNFISPKSINQSSLEILLREYQKSIKLRKEEKIALYFAIKHRFLGVIFWFNGHLRKHPGQIAKLKRGRKEVIAAWKTFDRLSLNDFLRTISASK